jgi:aldose 1-epimerase
MANGITASQRPTAIQAWREPFGVLPGEVQIEAVVLDNGRGVTARILTYGATLQALIAPDRDGRLADIVLGHDTLDGYLATPEYLGVTVGRYANRIAGGAFTLNGQRHVLARNNGDNSLHGGLKGFDKVVWTIETMIVVDDAASVTLRHLSPDGDEGFPGALDARVTYTLDGQDRLSIRYQAVTDRPTVVNLTNHSYFNLAGATSHATILDHRLWLAAEAYTPVDAGLIPTGELRPVAGGPFDFRRPTAIGARIHAPEPQLALGGGYDHNLVLTGGVTAEPRLVARLEDPASGRVLELLTTEPGLQLYSGNFLNGSVVGKGGRAYGRNAAVCLEPQRFPDSPNQPDFPSARLDPDQTYGQVSVFKLSTT